MNLPYHEDSKTWKPCSVFVVSESDPFSKSRFVVVVVVVVVVVFVLSSHFFFATHLIARKNNLLPDFVQVVLLFFSSQVQTSLNQSKVRSSRTRPGKGRSWVRWVSDRMP